MKGVKNSYNCSIMNMEEIKTTDQTNLMELAIQIDEKCERLNSLMVDRIQPRDELIN